MHIFNSAISLRFKKFKFFECSIVSYDDKMVYTAQAQRIVLNYARKGREKVKCFFGPSLLLEH